MRGRPRRDDQVSACVRPRSQVRHGSGEDPPRAATRRRRSRTGGQSLDAALCEGRRRAKRPANGRRRVVGVHQSGGRRDGRPTRRAQWLGNLHSSSELRERAHHVIARVTGRANHVIAVALRWPVGGPTLLQ